MLSNVDDSKTQPVLGQTTAKAGQKPNVLIAIAPHPLVHTPHTATTKHPKALHLAANKVAAAGCRTKFETGHMLLLRCGEVSQ
jgi:hypothetical protein